MAADAQNADKWPIAKFHFRATIDGNAISFQEVSGLDQETQVIEYRHGDSDEFHMSKRAGLMKFTNVIFKKGVFQDDGRLLELFNKVYQDKAYYGKADTRMDILVELLDEAGDTMMHWNIVKAFPIKLQGTTMKSDSNEVAIETIEFAHEGITVEMG